MPLGYKVKDKALRKCRTLVDAKKICPDICDFYEDSNDVSGSEYINFLGRQCSVRQVKNCDGAVVITDALPRRYLVELVHHCLSHCLQPPNITNLHAHSTDEEKQLVRQNVMFTVYA
jgi:hypothetical protein